MKLPLVVHMAYPREGWTQGFVTLALGQMWWWDVRRHAIRDGWGLEPSVWLEVTS